VLGYDTFVDTVLTHAEARSTPRISLDAILQSVCGHYAIAETELKSPGKYRHLSEARGVAAWLILETGSVTLTALGRVTGRDVSTLSSAAKAIHVRAKSVQALAECLRKLKEVLLT
jgi:chromosomal replication initiation ATPase DnaA